MLQCDVLVIGAGASGIAAARRLWEFGLKVRDDSGRTLGQLLNSNCCHGQVSASSADVGAGILLVFCLLYTQHT